MKTIEEKIKRREYMREYYYRPGVKERIAKYNHKNISYICQQCGVEFGDVPSTERKFCSKTCCDTFRRGLHFSPQTEFQKRGIAFKGTQSKYSSLHERIRRLLGKAVECVYCGSNNFVEWANVSHQYKKDLEDWISLCKKCHFRYDFNGTEF